MSKKLVELKPCPFCGEVPKHSIFQGMNYIRCNNDKCLIQPETIDYYRQCDATKAWNTRKEQK